MKPMFRPRLFAVATASLTLAVLFAGCPTDGNGNGAGGIPAALVGIWVDTVTGIEILRINADGSGSFGEITGGELRWSVDGNRLTLTVVPDGGGHTTSNTGNWVIVGGRLRLSGWEGPMAMVLNMMIPDELERQGGGAGEGGDNGTGGIPAALVGIWVDTVTGIEILRINADGSGSVGAVTGGEIRWSVAGSRLTLTLVPDGGGPSTSTSGYWVIVSDRLWLSNWVGPMAPMLNTIIPEELVNPLPLEGAVEITYTGTLAIDTFITATTANLTGGGAVYFQWQRGTYPNFTNIGAPTVNGNTHTVTNADVDHHIRVVVTRAGTTGQIESGYVGPVNVPRRLVADQIADLRTGVPPAEVTITTGIVGELIAPQVLAFGGKQITITLTRREPGDTLYLASPGAMFTVGNGVTLILEDIEIRGLASNTNALVAVQNGGTLIMDTGARIAGNTNTRQGLANQGGGVRIYNGGIFTMEDGEISGNIAIEGGGVLNNSGTFTMHRGEISGNVAQNIGGGVANWGAGNTFFNMRGGTISANAALAGAGGGGVVNISAIFRISDGLILGTDALTGANTASTGAALLHASAGPGAMAPVSQFGLFNNGDFTPIGNLSSTSMTIEVVNGDRIMPSGALESLSRLLPVE